MQPSTNVPSVFKSSHRIPDHDHDFQLLVHHVIMSCKLRSERIMTAKCYSVLRGKLSSTVFQRFGHPTTILCPQNVSNLVGSDKDWCGLDGGWVSKQMDFPALKYAANPPTISTEPSPTFPCPTIAARHWY